LINADPRSGSNLRAPLAGISALLVVSLVMGAHLRAVRPGVGEVSRESLSERTVIRHLAQTAAKATREPSASDRHKPGSLTANPAAPRPTGAARGMAAVSPIAEPQAPVLRAELLDLPPPALPI
jgi:hypothetical protein